MGGEGKNPTNRLEGNQTLYAAFPVELSYAKTLADLWRGVRVKPTGCVDQPLESLHLTMIYLGEVRHRYVASAFEAIEYRIKELPPPRFRFHRFHDFSARHGGKSCVVAVADVEDVAVWNEFQRRLRRSLQEMLAPQLDDRPWTPHVSVATFYNAAGGAMHLNVPFADHRWQPTQISIYRKDFAEDSGVVIRTYPLPPA